ncbi:MAG TPA: zinc-dependent alcohol dehydrogenase family protein [Candidatus Limnocylindrales bacterium]|nr:zinc-dependent alcohol dehydrogenase family protein [Candidatus Limnocylindrales bacterium]
MRAFTITAPNAGEVRDVAVPDPGRGEVVISPAFVGICGTDYHIFRGSFLSTYPITNGHELSGTISAVGSDAGTWREGDRVTVDPTLYCGRCYHCLRRQGNHCDAWGAIGDTTAGGLAEYVRVPARNVYRVEDHESLEDAAFTEPLACVVWGIERLRIRPGDRALVFGAGPIGCLMTQMLALSPVSDIVVVDVAAQKLVVAREMGAGATLQTSPDLEAQLQKRAHGRKYDLVIDCTGLGPVIEGMFAFAAPNARIMLFGVAPPGTEVRVNPFEVYHQDWEILGSMAINYTFQQARDLIASGRVKVRPLLSAVATLDDVAAILGRPKASDEMKVMIAPGR